MMAVVISPIWYSHSHGNRNLTKLDFESEHYLVLGNIIGLNELRASTREHKHENLTY